MNLLPSFDCYPMFYTPRELLIPHAHRARLFRKAAGWNYPALIIDGLAAGVWNLEKKGRRTSIVIEPFRSLDSHEKGGIQEERQDIARFLDASVEVRYGTIG